MRLAVADLCGSIWSRSSRFRSRDRLRSVQRGYLGSSRGNRLRGLVSAAWKRLVDLVGLGAGPGASEAAGLQVRVTSGAGTPPNRGGGLGLAESAGPWDRSPGPTGGLRVPFVQLATLLKR